MGEEVLNFEERVKYRIQSSRRGESMGQENTSRLLASMEGPLEFMVENLVKLVIVRTQPCSRTVSLEVDK